MHWRHIKSEIVRYDKAIKLAEARVKRVPHNVQAHNELAFYRVKRAELHRQLMEAWNTAALRKKLDES